MKLDLDWEAHGNGIFKAATPAGLAIDQLFIDGSRQRMARYPNYDAEPAHRRLSGLCGGCLFQGARRELGRSGRRLHPRHARRAAGAATTTASPARIRTATVAYEGGWQNNRQMGMHKDFRMVENIFEELDAPGEWFHNAQNQHALFQARSRHRSGHGHASKSSACATSSSSRRLRNHPVQAHHAQGFHLPPRGPHLHGHQGTAAALRLDDLPRRRGPAHRHRGHRASSTASSTRSAATPSSSTTTTAAP